VVFQVDVLEEGVDDGEERGTCGLLDIVWDKQIAVSLELLELLGAEAIE
jgi:hypothetical protein